MNTQEKFESMLQEYGMFPEQAKKVMGIAMPEIDAVVPDYHFTWSRPADEYPEPIYTMIFAMSVKPIALKWLKENAPLAWFLPMFE